MLAHVFVLLLLFLLLHDCESFLKRQRRAPSPCSARNCQLSEWSHWSGCSQGCGTFDTQYRTRYKTITETCGGTCHYNLIDQRHCERNCYNGGTPSSSQCDCRPGYTGSCCQLDRNECQMNLYLCQPRGTCVNTHGSFRCVCHQGYVVSNSGTACVDKDESKDMSASTKVAIGCGVGIPLGLCSIIALLSYYLKKNRKVDKAIRDCISNCFCNCNYCNCCNNTK